MQRIKYLHKFSFLKCCKTKIMHTWLRKVAKLLGFRWKLVWLQNTTLRNLVDTTITQWLRLTVPVIRHTKISAPWYNVLKRTFHLHGIPLPNYAATLLSNHSNANVEGYFTKQLTSTLQSLKAMKDKKKQELLQTEREQKHNKTMWNPWLDPGQEKKSIRY